MPSTILSDNGVTSNTSGIKVAGSNDGILELQTTTAGGAVTTAMTINTSQAVTFAQTANLPNTFGFKNRIINGAMVIDQRNAGASVTPSILFNEYTLDRWNAEYSVASKFSVQQTTTAPVGFTNSLKITSTAATSLGSSDYYVIDQFIEGYNIADLAFGTASAKTVTLSFQVYSSLTGTFGGSLSNGAANRSYPFTYTISSANTWTSISVTIAGDTSGTWLTTTGIGMRVHFGLGVGTTYSGTAGAWAGSYFFSATGATSVVGTNGATFFITGVQLEVGSTATSFDYRDYGRELILCQRYYYKVKGDSKFFAIGYVIDSTRAQGLTAFPVIMRTAPSALEQSGTAGDYGVLTGVTSTTCTSVPIYNAGTSEYSAVTVFTTGSTLTTSQSVALRSLTASGYLAWSAEL
jgi:hypothetical protein